MTVPLFECGEVIFCQSWNDWSELHDRINVDGGEHTGNGASHTVSSVKGTLFIIGVFNGSWSTLAHECAHIAFDVCKKVGVTVEPGLPNETFCYLISRLVAFCESEMKKPG